MKKNIITLEMEVSEAGFLFNLLDQVNVRGLQQKSIVLSIMARITEQGGGLEEESAPKKKRVRASKKDK